MTLSRLLRTVSAKVILGAAIVAAPSVASAGILIQVGFAPPVLPVYVQPVCPGDGYIWTPGYWAYGPEGYYWVPGTWVFAPTPGYLWTPAYWGWEGGFYRFHEGYWGPHIGFYGGINYGFGYFGTGFEGGEWRGGHFFYNTAVGNFGGVHITNVYVHNVTVVNTTRVAFNGGAGGVQARPQPTELAAMREPHVQPTAIQQQHFQAAAQDRGQLASVNGGHPQMAAARTPQQFTAHVNALPATQRVAPGAPGARFNPASQPGAARPAAAPISRPAVQPQAQPRPQEQARPQAQPRPQEQARPQAQPRPQEQARPQAQPHAAPAPRPAPHEAPHEEKPR